MMLGNLLEVRARDEQLRRRGQMLLKMLMVLNVLNLVFLALVFFVLQHQASMVILIVTQAIYVVTFILARRGYVEAAGTIAALMISVLCLLSAVTAQGARSQLVGLIVPLLITGIVTRSLYTVVLCGVQVMGLGLLVVYVPQHNPNDLTSVVFIPLLAIVLVAFAMSAYVNRTLTNQFMADLALARREERELREEAEAANQAKSAFLAVMSHELRTPLNAIIGYSELFMEDVKEGDSISLASLDDLSKVHQAGHHLLELVSGVLDLAKIESGQMVVYPERVDLRELVDHVVGVLGPLAKVQQNTFVSTLPEQECVVITDRKMCRQILFNLLSNAIKFTHNGTVSVTLRTTKDVVIIEVSDTGIGMTPEQLNVVFEEFQQADDSTTREYGGTGLGLTLVKHFCSLIHGEVELTSVQGQGTTCRVLLPCSSPF